jgi:hypothetical protein
LVADVSTADVEVLLILHTKFTKCSSDEIKENEMGGACGTHRREERCIHRFGGET